MFNTRNKILIGKLNYKYLFVLETYCWMQKINLALYLKYTKYVLLSFNSVCLNASCHLFHVFNIIM